MTSKTKSIERFDPGARFDDHSLEAFMCESPNGAFVRVREYWELEREIERLTRELAVYEGPRITELVAENTQFMLERDRLSAALERLRGTACLSGLAFDIIREALAGSPVETPDPLASKDHGVARNALEIERLRLALEDAADMLHECALECADCDYGKGATGMSSEGGVCEECAPIREAERRARAAQNGEHSSGPPSETFSTQAQLPDSPDALKRIIARHVRWHEMALGLLQQVNNGAFDRKEIAEFIERSLSRISPAQETGSVISEEKSCG